MNGKRTASQNGKRSRTKGHGFERWLANQLKDIYPDARRLLEYQEGMGIDLENTGEYRFQCKAYKNYAPLNKIEEVPLSDTIVPVLVTKGDNKKPIAAMYLTDWIAMLTELHYLRSLNEDE